MFESDDETPVVWGGEETQEQFCARLQGQFGKGSRAFMCVQIGENNAEPFIMAILPGPQLKSFVAPTLKKLNETKWIESNPDDPPPGTRIG